MKKYSLVGMPEQSDEAYVLNMPESHSVIKQLQASKVHSEQVIADERLGKNSKVGTRNEMIIKYLDNMSLTHDFLYFVVYRPAYRI